MSRRVLPILLILFALCTDLFSQETAPEVEAKEYSVAHEMCIRIASELQTQDTVPVPAPPPSRWTKGTLLELGFSQLSLTNWDAGGDNNIALNAYVNVYRNYVYEQMFWENRMQLGYGFISSFNTTFKRDRFKKSDDRIIFDSKVGYRAFNKFFISSVFNMRTQFARGYTYPKNSDEVVLASTPFAPAYFSLGIGMDYKPVSQLSINFSALTGNLVIVTKEELRPKYFGADADYGKSAKMEFGAQLKFDYKHKIADNLTINSMLNFFSDYLNKPQNIKVYWDLHIEAKINKNFSTSLRTNLIYDDNRRLAVLDYVDENGVEVNRLVPKLQFKELLSLSFSYTFGEFKK